MLINISTCSSDEELPADDFGRSRMIFLGVPLEGGVLEDVGIPEKVDEVPWDEGLGQKDGASELEDVVEQVPKMELGDVVVVLVVEDGVEAPEDELGGGVCTAWDDDFLTAPS